MPKAPLRPSLPTSSSEFALPSSSSSPLASSSSLTLDDPAFLISRFRRPSLLSQKSALFGEGRLHSPLASSFTPYTHSRRRSRNASFSLTEDSYESDRERMITDSPTSGNNTPPLKANDSSEEDHNSNSTRHGLSTSKVPPLTPPRRKSYTSMDGQETYGLTTSSGKRITLPVRPLEFDGHPKQTLSKDILQIKTPRILNLLAESRPEEAEVKSEAAFQRLITSCSDLPLQPRTPRAATDRGRYPEEAVHEETQREETPSDDEETDGTEEPFAFTTSGGSEPINIQKPLTPAGSVNGDGMFMSVSETSSDSNAMEIDMPFGSPSMPSMMTTPISQWRYTPPPTSTSAMRSNKRKFDDRFDPYPTSNKRRAVSPALLEQSSRTPIGRGSTSRLPIAVPISIPGSQVNSACSSPTISGSYPRFPSSVSAMSSSPTMRSSMALASPILRPMIRRREGEEKEVEGAGEAVNGLTLG